MAVTQIRSQYIWVLAVLGGKKILLHYKNSLFDASANFPRCVVFPMLLENDSSNSFLCRSSLERSWQDASRLIQALFHSIHFSETNPALPKSTSRKERQAGLHVKGRPRPMEPMGHNGLRSSERDTEWSWAAELPLTPMVKWKSCQRISALGPTNVKAGSRVEKWLLLLFIYL